MKRIRKFWWVFLPVLFLLGIGMDGRSVFKVDVGAAMGILEGELAGHTGHLHGGQKVGYLNQGQIS